MRKMLYFQEDPAEGDTPVDALLFPADHVTAINVVNDQGIRIWFKNSDGQTNDHRVDVTTTIADTAEEAAEYFAQLCSPGSGMGYSGIYQFYEGDVLPGTNATNAAGNRVVPIINTITYNVGA